MYSEAELFDQVRKQLENAEANYTKNDALKLELDNIHKNVHFNADTSTLCLKKSSHLKILCNFVKS